MSAKGMMSIVVLVILATLGSSAVYFVDQR